MRLIVLALSVVVSLTAPIRADTAGPRAVIEAQIEAFQEDDFEAAFAFASDAIRGIFGTPERFGQMVRQGYPMVYRPAGLRFLDARDREGQLVQRVLVSDQAQRLHLIEYEMIETGAGWRINAVRLLPGGAAGA
ncbi:MAG: DUF4864 domain-containing protein [Pararhodobacter sp.]